MQTIIFHIYSLLKCYQMNAVSKEHEQTIDIALMNEETLRPATQGTVL